MYSFASFNANLINFRSVTRAPYCFKIQGQIYYQINESLYPSDTDCPKYGQLYIVDPAEAINYRALANEGVDHDILNVLEETIREHNVFVKSYVMMKEEINHQRELSGNDADLEIQLHFTLKSGYDRNRYNFQRVNEVAAVFVTSADGDIPESYVTIRNKNTQSLKTMSSMDPNVEPMIYPLFYPHGTLGWHKNIMKRNYCVTRCRESNNGDDNDEYEQSNRRVTRCAYIKYRMAIRSNEFNGFLLGRRLFQQWIVDNYVKVEKDRIQYIRNNQKKLRIDSYQGLSDHLNNSAQETNCQVGKMVVLPSTFVGSPRYMMQNYQDSMAIVRSKGKPDLFITMTCNPNWREIKDNLLSGQQASDRPDLCTRVFHLKKEYLMNLITKGKFFGDVAAHVHVVEFQKRGLPHAHILITLKNEYKLTTPEDIDKYISAEIPDPESDPELYDIVVQNMIHGPCNERCLENGKCSKHYPKEYREETVMSSNSYPYYRRRNNGRVIIRHGIEIDNSFVVPHCPELSRILNCHLNVEAVCSITSVKYLYKYVYKGYDAANIIFEETDNGRIIHHDEVKSYLETRYVSPVEACYRILSKPLHAKSHTITRLPVHLPQQQSIVFEDINDEVAVASAMNKSSMLMEYFELNARDFTARQYTYVEIPTYYVFKQMNDHGNKVYQWVKRKAQFNCIGRMYSVSPSQIELYRLRLLLLHCKGATSYNDLMHVNGIQCLTFSDTCLQLGLIEDDDEWDRALQDAANWMMPRCLRHLFVRLLIHCQPIHPEKLWENYKELLSEDYNHLYHDSVKACNLAYANICYLLTIEGRCITDYPSMPQVVIDDDYGYHNDISNRNYIDIGNEFYRKLNGDQKHIVDIILQQSNVINYDGFNCFYVDGPGGTGKTFVYNTLYNLLKSQKKNICCMAFTGIAATLLPEGKTVHKILGLPVPLLSDSSSNISMQSKEGEYLRKTDIFIWDEAPMAPRYALEIMDRTLRDVMNNDFLFGGKIVILGGDFRQLLPVLPRATRSEIIDLSIKNSGLWSAFHVFHLTQNMRVLENEFNFSQFVLSVGDGLINDDNNCIIVPEQSVLRTDNFVKHTYGHLIHNSLFDEMSTTAILSSRNVDVDAINNEVVSLFGNNNVRIYTSVDTLDEGDDNGTMGETILPEYLNTLNPSCLPPHKLHLTKNCIVMLIRNISIHEGLCNGTRLRILDLTNNLLKCKIITGDKSGDIVFLNRITLYSDKDYPFTFKRRQFPIKLAFAMTINKAQGQTFSTVVIDLRNDVFSHGQLYVAVSRVRSWNGLKLYFGSSNSNYKVKNYVYKEMFE